MRDSLFYTDEELLNMDNHTDENIEETNETISVENNVLEFLHQCDNVRTDMSDISFALSDKDIQVVDEKVLISYKTDINSLDVSKDIRRISKVIKELEKYRKENIPRDSLSDEEKDKLDKKYNSIVSGFVYLRNKQIIVYNKKVNEINNRIEECKRKLKKQEVGADVQLVLDSLVTMDTCEEITDKDLQKNKYLNNLDYKKLNTLYENVSRIEEQLKTDRSVSVDLWFLSNYIDSIIKELNNQLNNEVTMETVVSISDRMVYVYDNLIELDVLHELNRDKMDQVEFSKYSSKIVSLKGKFSRLEKKMFEKRKTVSEVNNEFKNYKFELNYLDNKNDILNIKTNEYVGKSNSNVLNVLSKYNKKNRTQINTIKNSIDEDNLEHKQVETLEYTIQAMLDNNDDVSDKINNPEMLSKFDDITFYKNKIVNIDKLIIQLEKKVVKLERPATDVNAIKEIDHLFRERYNDIKHVKRVLKSYKKANMMNEYNTLKEMLDKTDGKLEEVYTDYSGRRPLKVKNVKSANKVFNEYKKPSLISAGLSSMALLNKKVGTMLIPSIIHGNTVMGEKMPIMKNYANFANNVLGGFIGAKKVDDNWILADGRMVDENIVTTSLLKALAVCGGVAMALISPVLLAIKKIEELIKKNKLKQKLLKVYLKFELLLNEYESIKDEKSFEQFCQDKELSEDEVVQFNAYINTSKDMEHFSKSRGRRLA